MKTWAYKVWVLNDEMCPADEVDLQRKLIGFGENGWELVNVIPQVSGDNGDVKTGNNVFIFKKCTE